MYNMAMASSEFIHYCTEFAAVEGDEMSQVFSIMPKVNADSRGSFTEVMKSFGQWPVDNIPIWFADLHWLRQINRSTSIPNVCRGLHAQKGIYCQSKFVECVSGLIYDFIIDARPDSKTFGSAKLFALSGEVANKVFIPRGFLHGFYSPAEYVDGTPLTKNIFQYYIGGAAYNKDSEVCVGIKTVLPRFVEAAKADYAAGGGMAKMLEPFLKGQDTVLLSEKDEHGADYDTWMEEQLESYKATGKVWYR